MVTVRVAVIVRRRGSVAMIRGGRVIGRVGVTARRVRFAIVMWMLVIAVIGRHVVLVRVPWRAGSGV